METELSEKGYNLADLKALGCDGTAVNTGEHGGAIRLIEKKLSKPLQWVICLLHLNELPLRALFEHLDGPTSGPTGFSGPIGKALKNCHEKAICNFLPIQHNLGNVTADDLSTDQEYLKAICEAVSAGQCPESLANKHPGNLSHSRWLTLAKRVRRLYVATPKPSANLKILTTFIVQVYGPPWFVIKQKHSIFNAAPNFYRIIQLSRYLPRNLRLVVDESLQCNAFMAHPETILLAMLVDDRSDIRNLAIERIQNARTGPRRSNVRQLVPPTVNFDASDYTELIDWSKTEVTEPPLMSSMSTEELRNLCTQQPQPWMFKLPAHTQLERLVKDVTEASKQVCGPSSRDGFIRARQLGRRAQPTFETKGQYRTGDPTEE